MLCWTGYSHFKWFVEEILSVFEDFILESLVDRVISMYC